MNRIGDWLGLSKAGKSVGLHIGSSCISMMLLRSDPLRIVALGRKPLLGEAVIHSDVRLSRTLGTELAELAEQLRVPDGTGVVVAVEPVESVLLTLDDADGGVCTVRRQSHDRLLGAIQRSGLRLVSVDAVPAALARIGRLVSPDFVAVRGAYDWSVVATPGHAEAERSTLGAGPRLCVGSDLTSASPLLLDSLPIRVPTRLKSAVDLDCDAVALGAALAGFNLPPLVEVRPVVEHAGNDWAIQPVGDPGRRPGATAPSHQGVLR